MQEVATHLEMGFASVNKKMVLLEFNELFESIVKIKCKKYKTLQTLKIDPDMIEMFEKALVTNEMQVIYKDYVLYKYIPLKKKGDVYCKKYTNHLRLK